MLTVYNNIICCGYEFYKILTWKCSNSNSEVKKDVRCEKAFYTANSVFTVWETLQTKSVFTLN